ncbi:MAG: hypothetical protein DIJKHBIC_03326 [Thermoanaerobaculia bacterium]|nr:hypothetical protein [Thermoanaerobaculia bacterium]
MKSGLRYALALLTAAHLPGFVLPVIAAEPPLTVTTETFGATGTDGTGTAARFFRPERLCTDGTFVYVSDTANHMIRKIQVATGEVTTLAGSPRIAGSADGVGTAARFNSPLGITASGNFLHIADSGNATIRRLDLTTGEVVTVAGRAGEKGDADGSGASARFRKPDGILVIGSGSAQKLYITDSEAHTVRVFDGAGVSTLAGAGNTPGFADATGAAARFNSPCGLATDGAGNLYVGDRKNYRIRKIVLETGAVTTFAGGATAGSTDGTGAVARFGDPSDLAGGAALEGIYVVDVSRLRFVKFNAEVKTSTTFGVGTGIAIHSDNPSALPYVFSARHSENLINRRAHPVGTRNPEILAGRQLRPVFSPSKMVPGPQGTIYSLISYTGLVRIDPVEGTMTTIVDYPQLGGLSLEGNYAYIADNSKYIQRVDLSSGAVMILAGGKTGAVDGTGSDAGFSKPQDLASDGQGNLYIADMNAHTVRKLVIGTRQVTTVAGKTSTSGRTDGPASEAQFTYPSSILHDGQGSLYIGESYAIRKLDLATGQVSTVAYSQTELPSAVVGMALTGSKLTFTDAQRHTIRVIDLATREISTVAGKEGVSAWADGTGDEARLNAPAGIAHLGNGRFMVADPGNNLFRYATLSGSPVPPSTASFFVPVVLSASGKNFSYFTTELTATNRGTSEATVRYSYTAASGGGSGAFTDSVKLGPGKQLIVPDVIEFLRAHGLEISDSGGRVGTLWVHLDGVKQTEASVTARTTTAVSTSEGRPGTNAVLGRAGLAYSGLAPTRLLTSPVYLSGLRFSDRERSNIAVQNAGGETDGDITVRVSLFAGDGNGTPAGTQELTLTPGGFGQLAVDALAAGATSNQGFFAKVERTAGTAPYYAYGTINDNPTSDGSFVTPYVPSAGELWGLTLPVALEAAPYATEVILNNFTTSSREVTITYAATAVANGQTWIKLTLPAGSQRLIPDFVSFLRTSGAQGVGPAGPGFVGPVFITVDGLDGPTAAVQGLAISAKTTNPSPSGSGFLGLYYQGVPYGSSNTAVWVSGLQQDGEDRSNIALVNTGEKDASPMDLKLEFYNGENGTKTGERTVTVAAKVLSNQLRVLATDAGGAQNGYVKVTRVSGTNPFIAYGVINDGASAGDRTGDGAFLVSERAQ